MMENHVSKEQFLIEFFGMIGGRELSKGQIFTDNPNDIFLFIEKCKIEKQPAFISVNPRVSHDKVLGIEKLFFDFDYADKTFMKKLVVRTKNPKVIERTLKKREEGMRNEVRFFLFTLEKQHIIPLVVKTRKGFHVYIFLDKIYQITGDNDELLKEVYNQLQLRFMKNGFKYLDGSVIGDHKRMCRIPTSIHEISGEECILVKRIEGDKVIPDKFRGIDFYRYGGLKEDAWIYAVDLAVDILKKKKEDTEKREKEHKDNWEMEHGFVGKIRPCFQKATDNGEGGHQLRLALELEAYWAGYNTSEKMLELFKLFHDYNETKSKTQIEWFWKNKVPDIIKSHKWKPYRCTTLEDLNLCLKSQCPIYIRRKQKEGEKNEQKSA